MKIQVILEGGLGNQMFQYALGRSLSIYHGAELSLYTPTIKAHTVKRKFQLDYFGISGTETLLDNYVHIHESMVPLDNPDLIYTGLDSSMNYLINGYWQKEHFFKRNEEQIRKDFDLGVTPIEGRLLVQVRRTDYLNNPYHEYCDLEWYKKAISQKKFNEVFFVSDDIEWCKENFDYIKEPKTFIDGNEVDQFKAMYSCDRFIISNSSFGWWGAWWTKSKDVTCPEVWTPGNNSFDPSLTNWIKLKK